MSSSFYNCAAYLLSGDNASGNLLKLGGAITYVISSAWPNSLSLVALGMVMARISSCELGLMSIFSVLINGVICISLAYLP